MPKNVSTPRKRSLYPPGPLRERHEFIRRSHITTESQNTEPSPMAKNVTNFRMDADPGIIARESPLYAPGRGKAAGSKRVLAPRKPPYD